MRTNEIEEKIKNLPDHIAPEVMDYIDFLISKYGIKKLSKDKFKFDWEGGLIEMRKKYTSVELQHKALEWR